MNKLNPIKVFSSYDATKKQMPKYNAFAFGYGEHGHKGYDRNQEKRNFQKELEESEEELER